VARYNKSAGKDVKRVVKRKRKRKLKNGRRSSAKSRKRTIAVGLFKARKRGKKFLKGKKEKNEEEILIELRHPAFHAGWRAPRPQCLAVPGAASLVCCLASCSAGNTWLIAACILFFQPVMTWPSPDNMAS
jgi:hypothetical protein